MLNRRIRIVAVICVSALVGLLSSATASASDYTADRLDDSNATVCPVDPSPVIDCSLREAVNAAIADPGNDTVHLIAGTHALSLGPDTGITNQNGDIDYYAPAGAGGNLHIQGQGAPQINGPPGTTVDASGIPAGGDGARAFEFFGAYPVTVSNLAITGGHATFEGGGIKSTLSALLTLDDVAIHGNSADTTGGGVDSTGSPGLKVSHSRFYDNTSQNQGGAIAFRSGGGIQLNLIENSGFSNNRTLSPGVGGGAVAAFGDGPGAQADPFVTVENSTFDGNKATGFGGAMDVFANASAVLLFSTVTRNRANEDNTGTEAGGGLQNGAAAFFSVYASLIASNAVGTGGVNPDCSGPYNSTGYNVVTDLTGCGGFTAPGDVLTSSPGIKPLISLTVPGSSGGTVDLLPGSPAIDRAPADVNCPDSDQGEFRTRPVGPACDSGARECLPIPSINVSCYASPAPAVPAAAALLSTAPAVVTKRCKKKKRKKSRSAAVAKKKKKCKKKRR